MSNALADIIAAAQAAANNIGAAQAAAGAMVPASPQTQSSTAVQTFAPATPMSLEMGVGGAPVVDAYLKSNKMALTIGSHTKAIYELHVRLDTTTDVAFNRTLRFGNPVKYLRSYDGVTEARTGQNWQSLITEARSVDPKCTGDYPAFDFAFELMEDVEAIKKGEPNIAKLGSLLGWSSPLTGFRAAQAFVKNVILPNKGKLVEGVIKHKSVGNDKGAWGDVDYCIDTWKVVGE